MFSQCHDIKTDFRPQADLSIKNGLGSASIILNAGSATNFVYSMIGLTDRESHEINAITGRQKIIDRLASIANKGSKLIFCDMENSIFKNNLTMIDSRMPSLVAAMLLGCYEKKISKCADIATFICELDPFRLQNSAFYTHKIKELLCGISLGMKPTVPWQGIDDTKSNTVLKINSNIFSHYNYNRKNICEYLLNNTKFDTGSSSRHGFGKLYTENNKVLMKLNLQIRFI